MAAEVNIPRLNLDDYIKGTPEQRKQFSDNIGKAFNDTGFVTIANHGLSNGDRVYLNFTSGSSADGPYDVSNVSTNTFTVTVASATTNGNVTMYASILVELDCSNATSFYTLIPGEGILATDGIFVGIPNVAITTTLFYG
jgi:hypothetical protein